MLNPSGLLKQLDEVNALLGSDRLPIIYEGEDEFKSRSQTYGVNEKPADYLDSFNHFIRNQLNQSVALGVIVNKPKDLTREQLREVRLLLDEHGYSEAKLQSAWSKPSPSRNRCQHCRLHTPSGFRRSLIAV